MYINPKYAFKYFYAFEQLLKQFMPEVFQKLQKQDIAPFYYAAEW